MFFVDEPYVSEFFKRTVKDNAIPVERNLDEFTGFARKIGALAGVKNFPVHIELENILNSDLTEFISTDR